MKIANYDKSVKGANEPGVHTINCEVKGLELWVSKTKTGLSKRFRLRYRSNGKQDRVSIGPYPVITLKEAKEKALDHLRQLKNENIDPVEKARLGSFKSYYEKWIAKKLKIAEQNLKNKIVKKGDQTRKTLVSYESALRLHSKPLHNKHIMDITEEDINILVENTKRTKSEAVAHKVKNGISAMFNDIIKTSTIIKKNPVTPACSVKSGSGEKGQNALKNDQIKEVWERSVKIDPIRRGLLRMGLYTGMRKLNLEYMTWDEISEDLTLWTIPDYKFKGQRLHTVPLSRQAQEILKEMKKIRFKHKDKTGRFVFPFRGSKPPKNPSRLHEMIESFEMGFTSHAFRKTVYTIMRELRVEPDIVKACVGHQYKDELEKTYDKDRVFNGVTVMDELKRIAYQEYSDEIDRIVAGYYNDDAKGVKPQMISIVNISKKLKEKGKHRYAIKINGRTLTEFDHNREEKLSVCFRKASEAAERMEMIELAKLIDTEN